MFRHLGWSAPLPKTADPELDKDSGPGLVQLIDFIRKFSHQLIFTECVQLLLYGGGGVDRGLPTSIPLNSQYYEQLGY